MLSHHSHMTAKEQDEKVLIKAKRKKDFDQGREER